MVCVRDNRVFGMVVGYEWLDFGEVCGEGNMVR